MNQSGRQESEVFDLDEIKALRGSCGTPLTLCKTLCRMKRICIVCQ